MIEWCSEKWLFNQLSFEQTIYCQILHTIWYISGERLKEKIEIDQGLSNRPFSVIQSTLSPRKQDTYDIPMIWYIYEDPYENHFGDKAFLVKILYLLLYTHQTPRPPRDPTSSYVTASELSDWPRKRTQFVWRHNFSQMV